MYKRQPSTQLVVNTLDSRMVSSGQDINVSLPPLVLSLLEVMIAAQWVSLPLTETTSNSLLLTIYKWLSDSMTPSLESGEISDWDSVTDQTR